MTFPPPQPFGPLITAMVTPFDGRGAVDFDRAEQLAIRLLENGSTGLVVSGTTGESPTLTPEEKLELYRRVKGAVGRAPVIANTGDNDTAFSVEFSREAQKAGVDALLLVVPYYNKPSQEGLFQHFKTIADAVDLPCILYNVPGRTSRNMTADTQARLSEVRNIIGTKEASGNLAQIAKLAAKVGPEFAIYSGDDFSTLPMLTLGCCGCISVLSHVAGREFASLIRSFWAGNLAEARRLQLLLHPVIDALFPDDAPNPAPVKAGLAMQGFPTGGLRLPLVECTDQELVTLRQALEKAKLL